MDFCLKFTGYRGNADAEAAVEAANSVIDRYGLTYEDLTTETPSEKVREVFSAAVDAAWPNRLVSDPSYEGHLEVFPA